MSYEDRMKLYKEKYGSGKSGRSFERKNSKKSGYSKTVDKNYRSNSVKKNESAKKNYAAVKTGQKKPEVKKGLWTKIKSLFGKK